MMRPEPPYIESHIDRELHLSMIPSSQRYLPAHLHHRHWPVFEPFSGPPSAALAVDGGVQITSREGSTWRSSDGERRSTFEEDVAHVSEGFCPWCESPLERLTEAEAKSYLGWRAVARPRLIAEYGWCRCCLYGFKVMKGLNVKLPNEA